MAEVKRQDVSETLSAINVDMIERQWTKKALETLRATLVRSRLKEVVGSEIYALRGKEIEQLDILVRRFS